MATDEMRRIEERLRKERAAADDEAKDELRLVWPPKGAQTTTRGRAGSPLPITDEQRTQFVTPISMMSTDELRRIQGGQWAKDDPVLGLLRRAGAEAMTGLRQLQGTAEIGRGALSAAIGPVYERFGETLRGLPGPAPTGPQQQKEYKTTREAFRLFTEDPFSRGRVQEEIGKRVEQGEGTSLPGQILFDPFLAIGAAGATGKAIRNLPATARVLRHPLQALRQVRTTTPRALPDTLSESQKETVTLVYDIFKKIKPDVKRVAAEIKETRARGVGAQSALYKMLIEHGSTPEAAMQRSIKVALGGPLTALRDAPPGVALELRALGAGPINQMLHIAYDTGKNPTQSLNNQYAFYKFLLKETIPTLGEAKKMEAVFGPDLVGEMTRLRRLGPGAWETILDIANIPRALMSSLDLSAGLRQARALGQGNPTEWKRAFALSVKTVQNPKHLRALEESIENHPRFSLVTNDMEVSLPAFARGISDREEMFMSRFATKLPWVEKSQAAHTAMLTKIRWDVALKQADNLFAAGMTPTANPDMFRNAGRAINILSGRGPLGPFKDWAPLLNAAFFSVRLQSARVWTPFLLTQPGAARLAGRSMGSMIATNLTLLGLVDTFGGDDVSVNWKDWTSSEWGKIRIGPTRIDPWAGFQQFAVLAARMRFGEIDAGGDEPLSRDRIGMLGQFIMFKLSPAFSEGLTGIRGETVFGERVMPGQEIRENITPFTVQAFFEGMKEGARVEGSLTGGLYHGLLGAGLETVGLTVNAYTTYQQALDKAAEDITNGRVNNFDDLTDGRERELAKAHRLPRGLIAERNKMLVEQGVSSTDPVDLRVRAHWQDYTAATRRLEDTFRQDMLRGLKGKTLREKIQDYRGARAMEFNRSFSNDEQEFMQRKRDTNLFSRYRDMYWGAQPIPRVTEDGQEIFNFDERDARRREILVQARDAGLDPADVLRRNYDGFNYAIVRTQMHEYDTDMDAIRPYFDVAKRVLADIEGLTADERQYLLDLYHEAASPKDIQDFSLRRSYAGFKSEIRRKRKNWRRNNPALEDILQKWGFVKTSSRRTLVLPATEQPPRKQPPSVPYLIERQSP